MAFTVVSKDAPAKVEGALNTPKSARDRAIEALIGEQKPAPVVDPAAAAASNTGGGIDPAAFAQLQAKAKAESTQSPTDEGQAQGTPPGESTPEATKPKEGTEQPLSPRYAQLARQEKALRAREAQIKADKAEFEAAKQAMAVREAELQTKYVPKERLSRETLAVLAEAGIDYNSLTQQALSEEAPDPRDQVISALQAQVAAIEEKFGQHQKSIEDDRTKNYQNAKGVIHRDVTNLVSKDPNFETIMATDSIKDVVDLIETTFHEGLDENHPPGTMLTVEEAAQIVEDYLSEEAEKLARLSKIQKRLSATKETSTPSTKQDSREQTQPKPTLTNGMTGAPKREYSARDRAVFAAKFGPNWKEKVGDKAS